MPARTLSESDSKALLSGFGVPFAPERVVATAHDAVVAAREVGLPVVAKLNGDAIAHKTERGLVRLALADEHAVRTAAQELLDAARPDDGEVGVLVAPMLRGNRELIAGLADDPQFGMTVMVGIGGIFAEAIADVAIRPVPITAVDAAEMIDELETQALLGSFRGEPAVDRDALARVLLGLSAAATAAPMTPASRPSRPACTAAATVPAASASRIGTQSATRTASPIPSCVVTSASAFVAVRSINPDAAGAASTTHTSAPCTWRTTAIGTPRAADTRANAAARWAAS